MLNRQPHWQHTGVYNVIAIYPDGNTTLVAKDLTFEGAWDFTSVQAPSFAEHYVDLDVVPA